jgi:membrane dipeptidase
MSLTKTTQSRPDSKTRIPVADGHVDLLYHLMRKTPGTPFSELTEGLLTPVNFTDANLFLVVSALYCADHYNGPQKAVKHLQALYDQSTKILTGLTPVAARNDLKSLYDDGKKTGLIHLLENADALVDDDVGRWQERGIRIVGLTHAGQNRIGSGNAVKNPSGLTAAGRKVVQDLFKAGLPIDIAHLAEPSFAELIKIYDGPLISSHTGLRHFCDLPRNLSDNQVRFLVDQKGIVGITVNPEMLAPNQIAGIDEVFKHIDWLVQRYEDRQVALGSDFGGFDMTCEGLADPGQLPALIDTMAQNGYPQDAIKNIMGRNWMRFYEALLP